LPTIAAAGLHGAELRRAGHAALQLYGESTAITHLHGLAVKLLQPYARTFVEFKGHAIALHYRELPDAQDAIAAIADRLLREAGDGFELQAGNLVYEIKPHGTSKATAIEALMADPPFSGRTPWVFGDDLTDEHAFREVNTRQGISVIVGDRRPTAARYGLDNPAALLRWIAAFVSA
jgi:trehalose 6-phosphate phosphatase